MTPERLAEIEARAEAATAEPWTASGYDVYETRSAHGDVVAEAGLSGTDAEFIAHARVDVPDLVVEVRRLRGWLDELELAAGMGSLADVAAHQRSLGVEGDHETRLRAKRVAKLKSTVMEEHEWRRQVLHEWQERAERSEEDRDRRAAADATDDRYWDGFDAALTAVEEGQVLYGTTKKAVAALRVVSRVGRKASPVADTLDGETSSS
jgi:hypothetical protein